jgi:nucleotide-binding universal stress UspA family protein
MNERMDAGSLEDSSLFTSSRSPGASERRILFGFVDRGRPAKALLRAHQLGRALGAELYVHVVIPPREPFAPIVGMEAARAILADWVKAVLGEDLSARLTLSTGRFVPDVAEVARALSARWIVTASQRKSLGSVAAKLARRAGVPVFVARENVGRAETIVAATDLSTERLPVLHEAARLGDELHRPVVAVHNVSPILTMLSGNSAWGIEVARVKAETARRARLLAQASQWLRLEAGAAVVGHAFSPVDTILREAARRAAHIVVVGTHVRTWPRHWLSAGVAARVVNRARCSVLVTPIA